MSKSTKLILGFCAMPLLAMCGCSFPDPPSGTVICAATQPQCPGSYECSPVDNKCYKHGTGPKLDAPVASDSQSPIDGARGPDANHPTDAREANEGGTLAPDGAGEVGEAGGRGGAGGGDAIADASTGAGGRDATADAPTGAGGSGGALADAAAGGTGGAAGSSGATGVGGGGGAGAGGTGAPLDAAAAEVSPPDVSADVSDVPLAGAPTISSFKALPATISAGKTTTLSWAVVGATALSIDQAVGAVTGSTSTTVAPPQTTTYTLTAQSASGVTATAQVLVTVVALPVITSFLAQPATISAGASSTLIPIFSGGATATVSRGLGNVTSGSGLATGALTTTTTFTLTVTNAVGDFVTKEVSVAVVPLPTIASFLAGASSLVPGASTTLTATFANGSGTIDEGIGAVTSGSGVSSGNLSATTTFTLTVTNPAGDTATSQVTVAVAGFIATGSLATGRRFHTATLLASGKVLIAGGTGDSGALASAEVFDPATGSFAPVTSPMTTTRSTHTATLLGSGKVLLAGGLDASSTSLASAELYDPAAGTNGTFTLVAAAMTEPRDFHTATFMPTLGGSGKVLLAGGDLGKGPGGVSTAELYDPTGGVNGTFAATLAGMTADREQHTATTLTSGKVLFTGGSGSSTTAEFFNPSTGFFSPTDSGLSTGRWEHTASLLDSGKVLVTGGLSGFMAFVSTEIYNPTLGATGRGTFSNGVAMTTARNGHTATLLTNGKTLIAGGGDSPSNAELADATAATFAPISMITSRFAHTATRLNDGKVLLVGGQSNAGTNTTSAELYVY